MKTAVIVFPGSNCDRDLAVALERAASFCRILATGAAFDADAREVADPDGATRMTRGAADLVRTALREAEEEIALPPGLVEVVGPLSTLVSRHGIEVTPYVAFIPDFVEYQPNDGEIAAVFNVPLSFFRDDPREVTHRIDYFGRSWYVPSYRFGEFKIWGLTAIMVVELVNLLYDDPIDLHTPPASFIKLS